MSSVIDQRSGRLHRMAVGALAAVALTAGGILGGLVGPVSSASAATGQSCSFADADTGTYASTICWLDMSAYSATEATSDAGQSLSYSIPGGYTLSFTLTAGTVRPVRPVPLPTFSAAYLGNNGDYTGVGGEPALYTDGATGSDPADETLTQSDITMTDSAGNVVSGWSLVGADAESTDPSPTGDDTREALTWNSSNPITSLTTTADGGTGLGNACGGGFTGVGTTTVTCTAGTSTATKTGTAILASISPTTFTQTMHMTDGSSVQAAAFGVLVSKLTLDKDVAGRIAPADSFDTSITSPEGTTVATATTGTAASTSTTGAQTVLPRADGDGLYTMAEAASPGSTTLALYGQSWTCTNSASASTTILPSGSGTSHTVNPAPGDDITCTITNAPASYTVAKSASTTSSTPGATVTYTVTVVNTGPVAYTTANPASFADDLSNVTDDATYVDGSATNGAVVTGNTLSWSGPLAVGGTETIAYRFAVNDPDTGDKTLTNAVTPTSPGGACATTDGCTTTTPIAAYTVAKNVDKTTVAQGGVVHYTITVTNTGQVAYTTGNPASFTDDLSRVTDDATYGNDASNGATVTGNTLSWSGALGIGDTIAITYSFTVKDPDTGDRSLGNVVDPGDGGACAATDACQTMTTVVTSTPSAVGPTVSTGGTIVRTGGLWPMLGAAGAAITALMALLALAIRDHRRRTSDGA